MRKLGKKNKMSFIVIGLIALIMICMFVFFINFFKNYDNNTYDINTGSILYTDELDYVKAGSDAKLVQKIDGKYYLVDKEKNEKRSTKIGTHAVLYSSNLYEIVLYGKAYKVLENKEVQTVKGKTSITKSSPSKFYKLGDRKYLFVDGNITSSDNQIKTKGYLIISIDKKGNAELANNELNVKLVKPITLKGSLCEFDIANEQLIYKGNKINLKNIIGSTNEYVAPTNEKSSGTTKNTTNNTTNNVINNTTIVNNANSEYYDNYLLNVINGVNNLRNKINNNNIKTAESISSTEIYFDFSRWISLSSVTSTVKTVTINYTVFDPNTEYASVYAVISGPNEYSQKVYLNKTTNSYIFRNLKSDTKYTITFGYSLYSNAKEMISDVVVIKTQSPTNKMIITKITEDKIYYKITMDNNYIFTSGNISLYKDGEKVNTKAVTFNNGLEYSGYINYSNLGLLNEVKLENIIYNGSYVDLEISSKFTNE